MIADVWRQQAGKYFCISTKSKGDAWQDHFFERDQVERDDVSLFVQRMSRSCDVYFSVNGYSTRRRKNWAVVHGVWLYADLDEVKPWELEPTLALRTSPGRYQALWRCDDTVSDDLNQRLTYHLGADKGGWGGNKVLRIPGTTNHKYAALPCVAMIWDGGPTYRVSDLEQLIPKLEKRERKSDTGGGAVVPVERCLRWASVRQCMYPAAEGKRSDVIAKLIHTLNEKGCDRDGIAWALLRCPSFIDKRGRDEDKAHWEIDNCLRNNT